MGVHSISSISPLSPRSVNFCPEAQCPYVHILPKHNGQQPSVYTQVNSQSKLLFSVFRRCFHVVLNRLRLEARSNMVSLFLYLDNCQLPPTMDVRVCAMFWPTCTAALALCPTAKPPENGDGCHFPLPSAGLETSP